MLYQNGDCTSSRWLGMSRFRGVSPVVAVALLILVAVATTALLYAWVSGVAQERPAAEATLRERIKIDAADVDYDGTNINATIYVRNIGEVGVVIDAAYLVDPETGTILASSTNINQNLGVDQVSSITIPPQSPAGTVGDVVLVKVVTERGTEALYTAVVE